MERFNSGIILFATIGIFLLYGCSACLTRAERPTPTSQIEWGRPIKTSLVSEIQRGETTQAQVVDWFGAPTNRAATDEDVAYTYLSCKVKAPAAGMQTARGKCATLFIVFDRATAIVKDLQYVPASPDGQFTKVSPKGGGVKQ